MNHPQTILTGDRPTGQLHLGHYVGSLRQRVALQHNHQQFILIADLQGLTDNGSNPQKVSPPYPRSDGRLSGRRH
ncbi:tryptophanyl-tRNA synthetase [Klebsiella pneumoniae]|uniref:Tryptophanyl-tRNA synthetase n=1 Tax=Klebsiella pneumoniae TaxID=573 RepID=A0A2X3F066_KLEPN|nr:tryptophanyl-tRNA synthetase [Klebsiella pneumoniae]